MKCGYNCGYWWQDEDEDYPSYHFDSDSPWPAPCEYDGEEMTLIATMRWASIPTKVAIPTIVERRNPLNFFCAKLLLDKCGNLWYNKGGVQRAAHQ